jgi:hypothetical protein
MSNVDLLDFFPAAEISADIDKWQQLKFREKIWKFVSNEIQGRYVRSGNVFYFESSRDAVAFKIFCS